MHSTNNLEDRYLGSGKYLWYAINKYGKENFHIEILEFFDTREALAEAEKKLVTEFQVKDVNCMNLKLGGRGGFTREESDAARVLANEARITKLKQNPEYRATVGANISKGLLAKDPDTWVRGGGRKPGFKLSVEHIRKIKHSRKGNSQEGTIWITDGKINKKIKKEDTIPQGFTKGQTRKQKQNGIQDSNKQNKS